MQASQASGEMVGDTGKDGKQKPHEGKDGWIGSSQIRRRL